MYILCYICSYVISVQGMAIVYGQCFEEIGPFNDTSFMVRKLEEVRNVNPSNQDPLNMYSGTPLIRTP